MSTSHDRDPYPDDGRGPDRNDAGHGPGMHPEARRSGSSRSTALAFAVALVLAAVLYAAIAIGIAGN